MDWKLQKFLNIKKFLDSVVYTRKVDWQKSGYTYGPFAVVGTYFSTSSRLYRLKIVVPRYSNHIENA